MESMTIKQLEPITSSHNVYMRVQIRDWESQESNQRKAFQMSAGIAFLVGIALVGFDVTILGVVLIVAGIILMTIFSPDYVAIDSNKFSKHRDPFNNWNFDGSPNMDGNRTTSH